MQLTQFYRPIRFMMGDVDPLVQRYPDPVLRDAVKTVVQLNKLPGYGLSVDELSIDPTITDPNKFALACYHACKLFVDPQHDRYSYRTRALSESFGNLHRFLLTLELEIHRLENGEMFLGWQNYFCWISGMAGLPLAEVLTQMNVESPLWNATLTREGIRTLPNTK